MRKKTTSSVLLAMLFAAGAVCGAAEAKPAAKAKAATAAAKAKAPAKTLDQLLSFLPDTVAQIGSKKILKKEIMAQLNSRQIPKEVLSQIPQEQFKMILQQQINQMVDQEVMLASAEKAGFKPGADLVRKQMDEIYKKLPKQQRDMFDAQMKKQGKSFASYKDDMAKNTDAQKSVAISLYLEKTIKDKKIKVTDAEVEKFYRENQKQFEYPETVTVSHILALSMDRGQDGKPLTKEEAAKKDQEAKKKIEKVYAELKQGKKFEDLAAKYSDCPSGKNTKGVLPSFDKNGQMSGDAGAMDKIFTDAAFGLKKPGQTTEIVKTQFGYHIIRLNDRKAAGFTPLAEVKKDLTNYLTQKKNAEFIQQLVLNGRKAMNVKVFGFDAPAAPAAPAAKK